MNDILEEVFLHDDVRGGKAIAFITAGLGAPGLPVGYIVKHDTLGPVYVAYACHPQAFLTPYHLKTIADRLQQLHERQAKVQKTPRP